MTEVDTVTLTRSEYKALLDRTEELEDALAAWRADDGRRIPHEVALAVMGGERPVLAFRRYRGLTLRDLATRTGLAVGYLSEIERGLKPGSAAALSRIAAVLDTTIDALVQLD